MHIVTNFPGFPAEWRSSDGRRGTGSAADTIGAFVRHRRGRDTVFLVDCNPGLVLGLSALFLALPFLRRPLIALDLVLRRPLSLRQRLLHPLKRFLLARADLYINYFADVRGLTAVYGISPKRCTFVPFKANLPEPDHQDSAEASEDYVLCFGRSMRDFDTFFAAVERLPWPAAVPQPDRDELARHGSRFTRALDQLPSNVRLLDDDGTGKSQADMLRNAKLVVLPILTTTIVASGISTCLNAMLFRKCVIGSDGPGMSDIFKEEVLTVPPADPAALAAMIDKAWRDDDLRRRTALAGYRYAHALGGTPGLIARIIDAVVQYAGR
jgi:glycosyltransferase involved in cell wall biosynthesis